MQTKNPGKKVHAVAIKSITRSLIIFKKPRKMTNDFFNHYIFVCMFQWTSSEHLTSITITVKVAIATYKIYYCENGKQKLMSEAYLETYKHASDIKFC